MKGSRVSFAVAVVAVTGALGVAACKSSTGTTSCGSGTAPAIAGTYAIQSYDIGGTLITSPNVSGQLRLNANKTYGVNLDIQPSTLVADSGTYVIQGASCISQNSVLGQPQFIGTFTLTGTTLAVTGSAAGQAVASVWTKTS